MPEKPLTIATYAAGASLAAITLVYVFAPTYIIDSDANSARKKGVVGLTNRANDCFINSILQVLAGLTDLRVYLIREIHRRNIDEAWVYEEIAADPAHKNTPQWKIEGLQAGLVTKGLKEVLDALNERPIYKKTISAAGFVRVLEQGFRLHISRTQQDAQEFLQIVTERLCDEYHAGKRARQHARAKALTDGMNGSAAVDSSAVHQRLTELTVDESNGKSEDLQHSGAKIPRIHTETEEQALYEEDGFPLEGKYESQIECETCGFKPRPTESTFCTLILNVPQVGSTSLNACLDAIFKTEDIDDYKCEKCRLVHAKGVLEAELAKSTSESFRTSTAEAIQKLQHAVDTDPEHPPPDVVLPDTRYAPKRKIKRHTRLISFPKILSIHLSRSTYDGMATKISAKVSFPERLPLGSLLKRKNYRLLGAVTHKGSHQSGHYESFRRQNQVLPYSTTNTFQQSNAFTKSAQPSPAPSPQVTTPQIRAVQKTEDGSSPTVSTPDLLSSASGASSSSNPSVETLAHPSTSTDTIARSSSVRNGHSSTRTSPKSAPRERDSDTMSLRSVAASAKSTFSKISQSAKNSRPGSPAGKQLSVNGSGVLVPNGIPVAPASKTTKASDALKPKKRKHSDRWWRISDEKIKEAKTSEVLGMQREIYLLFYELERESAATTSTGS